MEQEKAVTLSERLREAAARARSSQFGAPASICTDAADALAAKDAKDALVVTDDMIEAALVAHMNAKLEHWQGFERMRLAITAALAAIRKVQS